MNKYLLSNHKRIIKNIAGSAQNVLESVNYEKLKEKHYKKESKKNKLYIIL